MVTTIEKKSLTRKILDQDLENKKLNYGYFITGGNMRFFDELNNIQNKNDDSKNDYLANLKEIHNTIRMACKENNNRKKLDGYIAIKYDNEYGVSYYVYIKSLYKDNNRNLSLPYVKNGSQYPATIVSDEYYKERDGFKPISKNRECERYINDLHRLLSKDGFTGISLNTVACYNEYDEVLSLGMFSSQRKLVRKSSNVLLGYVISVSLNW